jgi:hypothetical protein
MPPGFTQVNNPTLALPTPQAPVASVPTQTDTQRANAFRDAGLTQTEQTNVLSGVSSAAAAQRSVDTAGATGVVADNGTARADEKTLGDRIRNEVMNPTLDLKYLDDYETKLNERRAAEEKNINTNFDNLKVSTERQQQGEVGSTSSALARAGGYLGVSGSGTGVLLNLANTHRAEMSQIEAKRQDALAAARSAYEDKQFAIAQKRYDEAKAFKDQSFTRQKEYFDTVKKTMDDIKKTERAKEVNNLIYGAINEGKTDPTDIFGLLQGSVTPEEVDTFFTKLKPKAKETDIFKPTNAQAATMLGSGLSAKQVNDLTKQINESGYSQDIKAGLTPEQRRVMDSILVLKTPKAAGSGGASSGLKISYVPEKLSAVVGARGASAVYDDLISQDPPDWFEFKIQNVPAGVTMTTSDMEEARKMAWAEYKKAPDISAFLKQVNKKIFGSADDGTGDFGAVAGVALPDSPTDLTE